MIPVKRVEIVVVAPLAGRVTTIFARHGLKGWTMVPNVRGQGEHGIQRGDDLTGVSSNHLLVTTCKEEQLESLVADLRPLLARSGGACLVSDASWVEH